MFLALIKRLFGQEANKPNYYYFEETKGDAKKQQEQAVSELETSLISSAINPRSAEEMHQQNFYDFLFGQSPATREHDELSVYVANKIERLLNQPQYLMESLPALPTSLSKVIEQLNDEEFDINQLLVLIEQEPIIAAKVIELANSSFYNHSQKEVTDLKAAFMHLGANGLVEGVINGFVAKLTPQSKVYFQHYGNKIWQHSLSTGVIGKMLLSQSGCKNLSAQGYLIGLICNLGDMIIFQLLIEAFAVVHPDCQPNSFAFKELMSKKSKVITYHIAKYWRFPPQILDALALQAKLTKSAMLVPLFKKRPLDCYIFEANLISELKLMFEHGELSAEQLNTARDALIVSQEGKILINSIVEETITT